jgi:hypothetical protein
MLIKIADDKSKQLATLEALLKDADSLTQKRIKDELRIMHAGIKGEQESAYQIDFHLKESTRMAIIHDLRLSIAGRVAQIDHLLIHQSQRFYVLETKHFTHGLKINDQGEFLRWNEWKKCYEGMPSPIEQNARHIKVLHDLLERLGYKNPSIQSFVLISPHARIDRAQGPSIPEVVKADQFFSVLKKDYESSVSSISGFINAVAKLSIGEAVEEIAKKVVAQHHPIEIDYAAKFGVAKLAAAEEMPPTADLSTAISAPTIQSIKQEIKPDPLVPQVSGSNNYPVQQCKKCLSENISIQYGNSYYFKCADCNENSAIKISCGISEHKERIRKDKSQFFRECSQCGTSSLFFVNKQ